MKFVLMRDKKSKKSMTQRHQNELIVKQLASIKSKQRHLQMGELFYLIRKLLAARHKHAIPLNDEPLPVEDDNNLVNYSVFIGDASYIACNGGFAGSYEEKVTSKAI